MYNQIPVFCRFAIPVPAVNADIMALVAEFMYTGQVELEPESLFAVLDTANYFEVGKFKWCRLQKCKC